VTIAGVVSNEARALVARAAQIAADCMRSTHGEAPAPWCLLVLGSAGRGESLLAADQDNALIHGGAGEPDWFAVFGALVSDLLDQAGMPRCKGGVMAANAQWRGNEHAWRARLDGWLGRARPEDLLHVDIFFDSVAVAGDASLARRLLDDAMSAAARAPAFLACLAQSVIALRPARGLFGGLRTENGRIDLKLSGLLPLVSMARTLALRVGSKALSTPDRLRAAADGSRLSSADLSALLEVHADLTEWILRGQLADLECGLRPSGRIAIKELGRDAVHRVQRHLRTLDGILEMLPRAISG
jgi:DNA polymerase-3 subunit epsilon/CBS domain-containing protein